MYCRGFEEEYQLLLCMAEKLSKPMSRKKFSKIFKKFVKCCIALAPFIGSVAALLAAIARLRSPGRKKVRRVIRRRMR